MSRYFAVFMILSIITSGHKPNNGKQTYIMILPPPNFTVGTLQSGRNCYPDICHTQVRPSDL
uniref:U111-Liphistoxin-Lth1a_1 n=1 Tax=Liphistius thaleban TaxID=1905330 RepID=A0A4Q8K6D2_9ARAC